MATMRVSEKEAIARGWIDPPPPLANSPSEPGISGFRCVLLVIGGWLLGFMMGLMFH